MCYTCLVITGSRLLNIIFTICRMMRIDSYLFYYYLLWPSYDPLLYNLWVLQASVSEIDKHQGSAYIISYICQGFIVICGCYVMKGISLFSVH